ncbi:Bodo-specific multi-copy gene family, putative [Bodo saltans]|uniref:Bodo-specific multi-copy gene family, putative n=1 Tax=Bodo saltans TaxID=75058 RepID=A0A0S4JJM3_BODSA|nr:Bodo-specific multi-copy gene family, putative [Bodo saltans]|eukprot:CUG89384.1 Bodo-specific multi-copy gene family, putative [Bodo saltans]
MFRCTFWKRCIPEFWKNTSNPWVSLAKVFEGAVQPEQQSVMERYEVNLSDGTKTGDSQEYESARSNAATYLGGNAHHDAYIWCRKKTDVKCEFAMPLQIRFGHPKTLPELKKQLLSSKSRDTQVQLLLSVNQAPCKVHETHRERIIMINAGAMCATSWLRES